MTHAATPVLSALKNRCPRCGQGVLFKGLLGLMPRCTVCDLDYSPYDQGDGPAPFAVFFVTAIVSLLGLWLEFSVHPPIWVHVVLWVPLILVLSLACLRLLKAWLVGEQYRNNAHEGQLSDREGGA